LATSNSSLWRIEQGRALNSLLLALQRLAQLQRQSLDRHELAASLALVGTMTLNPIQTLKNLKSKLNWKTVQWLSSTLTDPSHLPCLAFNLQGECRVLRSFNSQSQWVFEGADGETTHHSLASFTLAKINFKLPFDRSISPVWRLIKLEVLKHKGTLIDVCLSGVMLNFIALGISFYSMQIYDRVVPTGASATLWVLSLGVFGAIVFEWLAKTLRSDLNEKIIEAVDQRLGREVFLRLLNVRLDKLPSSVGSLAGQLKAYESVRTFLTSSATQLLIDAPFAIVFAFTLMAVAGWLALIPVVFLLLSAWTGLRGLREIENRSHQVALANMRKTGLLVEAIEGAETLKSGQGGWRQLSLWQNISDTARGEELRLRHISESSQHQLQALQQLAYVAMVATGALMVAKGELSMGSLIACSILSSRILQPIAALPSQLIQWGFCKSALQGLDQIWHLPDDHHGQSPVVLDAVQGHYALKEVVYGYGPQAALKVAKLNIRGGEKIGVLGPIGAGKTTLLRLLSGMYKPQVGDITLDGVDLAFIAKPLLAEQLGYLQQEGRLFEGTLRDNLLVGMTDPGDEILKAVALQTGLQHAVLANHPLGFDLPIQEGGQGLSGGQRQLVNLTRVFLRRPRIWLMDEPTAAMDRQLADHVTNALKQALRPQDTLVLVTHKPEMLTLVDRLVVIAKHEIFLDGPKEQVIRQLQT
jgi:ATP-binding cassette subfamily C protein LapB